MATNDKKINCGTVRDIFRDKICSPNNNEFRIMNFLSESIWPSASRLS